MPNTLHIESFCLGDWMTNCFVVHTQRDDSDAKAAAESPADQPRPCWIVDAGFNPQPMIEYIERHNLEPTHVLLTHAHLDHIAGLADIRQRFPDAPIFIHPEEEAFLTDPTLNLSVVLDHPIYAPTATGELAHGQTLELDGVRCEVRHTPGHSPGGVTFYFPDQAIAIVGDTLFRDSIGRSDFPTSDHATLMKSIEEQLLTLPDDTRILPGHMDESTIGRERRWNAFLM